MTLSQAPRAEDPRPPGADPSSLPRHRISFWNERPRPWVTWSACVLSVGIFFLLLTRRENPLQQGFGASIAPQAGAIWEGKYWALITTVFVHLAWWHVAFNVSWLWILGGAMERQIGSGRFLAFFLAAAVVSSGMELALAGATGIGLSGVVYAIFGFLWWRRRTLAQFAGPLDTRVVRLFFGWLVVCVVLTMLKIVFFGNAAHIAGLLFGASTAAATTPDGHRAPFRIAAGTLLAGSLLPIFWSPWSGLWVAHEAYVRQTKGDLPAAIRGYQHCLEMDLDANAREWALQNLAIAYRAAGDEKHFLVTLEKLRRVSPAAAREVEGRIPKAGQRQ